MPSRFFQILKRSLSKLVRLNLIFCMPALVALLGVLCLYFSTTHLVMRLPDGAGGLRFDTWSPFYPYPPGGGRGEVRGAWLDISALFAVGLPMAALAPFTAGLTLVTRNFVREEYTLIWQDFRQGVKENWKPFLLNGLLCGLFYIVLTVSVCYYGHLGQSRLFFHIPLWICLMLALALLFAQFYLPVMFITFDMTFRQAYKNALIFAVAGFGRNVLLAVVLAVLFLAAFLSLLTVNLAIFLPLYLFILFSFSSFLVNFTVWPVIDRYLIKPQKQK